MAQKLYKIQYTVLMMHLRIYFGCTVPAGPSLRARSESACSGWAKTKALCGPCSCAPGHHTQADPEQDQFGVSPLAPLQN